MFHSNCTSSVSWVYRTSIKVYAGYAPDPWRFEHKCATPCGECGRQSHLHQTAQNGDDFGSQKHFTTYSRVHDCSDSRAQVYSHLLCHSSMTKASQSVQVQSEPEAVGLLLAPPGAAIFLMGAFALYRVNQNKEEERLREKETS